MNINLWADGVTGGPQHGMHIHTGAVTSGCDGAGPHYNPFNVDHGAREDTALKGRPVKGKTRHVGDFGNVANFKTKGQKSIDAEFTDFFTSLDKRDGALFIGGRTFAIHTKADDLGRGGNAGSVSNGNSGPPLACCLIKIKRKGRY